jgi:hypothetical protein
MEAASVTALSAFCSRIDWLTLLWCSPPTVRWGDHAWAKDTGAETQRTTSSRHGAFNIGDSTNGNRGGAQVFPAQGAGAYVPVGVDRSSRSHCWYGPFFTH